MRTCTDCNGKGYRRYGFLWLFKEDCVTCNGTGRIPEPARTPRRTSEDDRFIGQDFECDRARRARPTSPAKPTRQPDADDGSVPALLLSIDDGITGAGPSADDKHSFGGGHSGGAGASGSWDHDHPTHPDTHIDSTPDYGGGDCGGDGGGGGGD